jgi:hypothetical protein
MKESEIETTNFEEQETIDISSPPTIDDGEEKE